MKYKGVTFYISIILQYNEIVNSKIAKKGSNKHMAFIDRLGEILEKKKISQYRLCKELEIGQSTISSWKKGKMPTVEKVIAIVQYLEVSADWLLETNIESFTADEQELIKLFRDSDTRGQRTIMQVAQNEGGL